MNKRFVANYDFTAVYDTETDLYAGFFSNGSVNLAVTLLNSGEKSPDEFLWSSVSDL